MTITDIVTNIDRRLAEARAELVQLQDAREALVNGARPTPRPAPRKAPRRPVKTTYQVVGVGTLTSRLSGSDGMSTRELSTVTDGDPAQVLALLKEQELAGQVRRSGTRAGTRWHLITDEDRIAARAAELEGRSTRSS